MSWTTVKASGSGRIAWRIMIPGHPIEFVSSPTLIGAGTDGRIRIGGLDAAGIGWSEMLDPAMCTLHASGFNVRIVEDGSHRTGDSFGRVPTRITTLTSSITAASLTIPLDSTNTANDDVLFIGQECMLITSGGGTAAPTVTRGYRNTLPQSHLVDDTLGLPHPEVTFEEAGQYNGRASVKGLLCYVYVYGDGEGALTDGTLVWRGIIGGEPKPRELTSWEFPLRSVAEILGQRLSADLQDPVTLRGIAYDAVAAPTALLTLRTTASQGTGITDTATIPFPPAFYESNEDWCAAFNAKVTTETATWGVPLNVAGGAAPRLEAVPTTDGAWGLLYTPDATPLYLDVLCYGAVDPTIDSASYVVDDTGASTSTVASGSTYSIPATYPFSGAGTVPRGFLGLYDTRGAGGTGGGVYVANTIYLGGSATLSTNDVVVASWPAFAGRPEARAIYNVTTWTAATRSAVLAFTDPPSGSNSRWWTADSSPEITIARMYVRAGNVGDFITDLVTDSPAEAPAGRAPFVTTDHVDNAATATAVDAIVAGRAWADQRFYGGASDLPLLEMLTEEMKLIGAVPSITTAGLWQIVEFRVGAATESTAYAINADTNLSIKQRPGFEPSAFGLVNTIKLKTGFDVMTGKHTGDAFNVRDASALSRQPLPLVMKIEPRSSAVTGDRAIPVGDVITLAQSWFGVLGSGYTSITFLCPLSALDCVIGTSVSITASQLPDLANGGRGVTSLTGFVIGRALRGGFVELTLLCTQVRIAGYAPSSLIESVTGAGDPRVVLLEAVQPTGYATASTWTVGDAVVLRQYDTSGSSEITATVTVVNTGTREITIGTISGATPAGTLTLEYGLATAVQASQEAYCFVATDPGRVIEFTSGDVPARQLAS